MDGPKLLNITKIVRSKMTLTLIAQTLNQIAMTQTIIECT